MKNHFFVAVAIATAAGMGSCDFTPNICTMATGAYTTDTLSLDSIHSLDVSGTINVFLSEDKANPQLVIAKGKADALAALSTKVTNGVWEVDFEGNQCFTNHDIDIYLTVADIQSLMVSGSSDIFGQDTFQLGHALELKVSGSGNINLAAFCTDIVTQISGSGDISLTGEAQSNDLKISGSGNFSGFDCRVVNYKVGISGSGDAAIYVNSGKLEGNISGSGTIRYKGAPSSINVTVSGSGKILNAN